MSFLQSQEQAEVVQPAGLSSAEGVEERPQVSSCPGLEIRKRLRGGAGFEQAYLIIVNVVRGEIRSVEVGLSEQAVTDQQIGADQVRIAGEGRETLVG